MNMIFNVDLAKIKILYSSIDVLNPIWNVLIYKTYLCVTCILNYCYLQELWASHKARYIEMVHVTALIGRMPAVICLVHLWIRDFTMYIEI